MFDNLTVIIRSVGERTEKLAATLLKQEVGENNVFIVHEVPFSKALKKSIEIGIRENKKWTLCVDADILIKKGSLKGFIDFADKLPKDTYKIIPYFVDKLFNIYRGGGLHLYRTSLLNIAIELIPIEGIDLRPEHYMSSKMKELGYKLVEAPFLLSVHDFEQSYKDIFRKCYIHAHKWVEWLPHFATYWRKMAKIDKDFQVALWGLASGIASMDNIRVNKDMVPFDMLLNYSNGELKDKADIDINDYNTIIDKVEDLIMNYQEEFENDIHLKYLNTLKTTMQKPHLFQLLLTNIGDFIEKIGKKIKWISRVK